MWTRGLSSSPWGRDASKALRTLSSLEHQGSRFGTRSYKFSSWKDVQFNNMGISFGTVAVQGVSCLPDSNRIQSLVELDVLVVPT